MAEEDDFKKMGFGVGDSVEAKDLSGDAWRPARILDTDPDGEVLVRFIQPEGSRQDEWMPSDSNRLRLISVNSKINGGDPQQPLLTKRERKQKFNVKDLLNLRNGRKSSVSEIVKKKSPERTPVSPPSRRLSSNGGDNTIVLAGKRERKRKKLWDEEEQLQKRPPKLGRRKSTSAATPTTTAPTIVPEYMNVDMTQPPEKIAAILIEGKHIPGPGVSIPLFSPGLPEGWHRKVVQRKIRDKWDVCVVAPSGKTFKSKTEIQKYVNDRSLNISVNLFDFTLDDTLKKLRNIWKIHVLNKETPSLDKNGNGELLLPSEGFTCVVDGCTKAFRNAKLLGMHVKHYHEDFGNVDSSKHPESFEVISLGGRKRNESGAPSTGSETATTPPTFRVSKRRRDELIVSPDRQKLSEDEVVNCVCGKGEEDGLMIQCDVCLCWQHGSCLDIDEETQVPEKHLCLFCQNPSGRRNPTSKANLDQDWLKSSNLPKLTPGSSEDPSFKKLSDLMADLKSLSGVLHSLRVKINVASAKTNSKVFMWSSPWPKPTPSTSSNGNDVEEHEGGNIDPSMIPSLSEVEQLLPSIMEAEGLSSEDAPIIPEPPKRIDKEESRNNLFQHIGELQNGVESRLSLIEQNLEILEDEHEDRNGVTSDNVKSVLRMLAADMSTASTLLGDSEPL